MSVFKKLAGKIKPATQIFKQSPREIQEEIARRGAESAEAASYIVGNKTEAIQTITNGAIDTAKGAVTTHSGSRVGNSVFKGVKDYSRGDYVCTTLCAVSGCCETAAGILVWTPIPGKIIIVSGLKGISYGCMKVRDLCAMDPSNPLC